MYDFSKLTSEEISAIKGEVDALYAERGGDDIDRAITRDRKVVAEHDRELDHVATLPFDKPYRWRIAPSVGLRAQKDLERQQKRRADLLNECAEEVLAERGQVVAPVHQAHHTKAGAPKPAQVDQLTEFLGEAMEALNDWKQERAEASPPVETAVA